jgi:hypothetical protein
MKFKVLTVAPWIVACVLLAAAALTPSTDRAVVLRIGSEGVKLLALVGCVLAALAFERGDYMRRAWALNGACFLLLLTRDVTLLPVIPPSTTLVPIQGALVTVANAASVYGTWLMARAFSASGLELPGSATHRRTVTLVAVIIAIAITSGPFVLDVRALFGGDAGAIVAIASDLGDVLSLSFIAPVLLTAMAMRGGLLRWTWGFFAAGLFAWLVYDATAPLASVFSVDQGTLDMIREGLRALACGYIFSAALAHRAIVKD